MMHHFCITLLRVESPAVRTPIRLTALVALRGSGEPIQNITPCASASASSLIDQFAARHWPPREPALVYQPGARKRSRPSTPLREPFAHRREYLGARQDPGEQRVDEGPAFIDNLASGNLISGESRRRTFSDNFPR
jgi:hypothetical protein